MLAGGSDGLGGGDKGERYRLPGAQLGQRGQIGGNNGGNFGITTCRLVVGQHHDGLAIGGNLHRARRDAVG